MFLKVIEFNKRLNNLEYNEQLEIDMFNEEAKEFFDAETTAERVDAFIDMEYVRYGTIAKLAYNGLEDKLPYPVLPIDIAINVLKKELGENFNIVLEEAGKIVCEINETKNAGLSKNGKAKKDNIKRNATKEIAAFLESLEAKTVETES